MRGYRGETAQSVSQRGPSPSPTTQSDDELYRPTLEILSKANGPMTLFEVGIRLRTGQEQARRVLDRLTERQLTALEGGEGENTLFKLTSRGKQFITDI